MKLFLAALAGVTLVGCNPRVLVEDEYRMRQAKVSLPDEMTGAFVGIVQSETPTTIVVTVTFNKKGIPTK